MRFRYLRDPLFLLAVATYLVNRWVLKAVWPTGFVHDHLNDLLCLPVWVPVMLWGQRRLDLRADDAPPRPGEILVPLVVWSWWFEVLLPASGVLGPLCVSDHRDILYYALGALAAGTFWQGWYAARQADPERRFL